jgi:sulfite reductase (NADPH) flavoprotein alpha-component
VEETLLGILGTQGNLTREDALTYLAQLEEEGRYSKDVY